MQIEIEGQDAVKVAQEILSLEGIQGSFEIVEEVEEVEEVEKEGTLVTIATIIGITTGTITLAEKLYELRTKNQNPLEGAKIERVLIVSKNGDRLLLKDPTIDQIKRLVDQEKA